MLPHVIKLWILSLGFYPGLCGWALNVITRLYDCRLKDVMIKAEGEKAM